MLRKLYQALVPEALRASPAVTSLKVRLFGHDRIYNAEYYARTVEGPAARSAPTIAATIVVEFEPQSVVDVGCGTGALLEQLRKLECEVQGLEYSEAGLAYCRGRRLAVRKFDLERDALEDPGEFDVAVSMEVAEHLPARVAERYVRLLARLAPVVVFTAAPPGQGGADHVNEQPPAYWIEKFAANGLEYDEPRSMRWRERWKQSGKVQGWYYRNLMLFRRK